MPTKTKNIIDIMPLSRDEINARRRQLYAQKKAIQKTTESGCIAEVTTAEAETPRTRFKDTSAKEATQIMAEKFEALETEINKMKYKYECMERDNEAKTRRINGLLQEIQEAETAHKDEVAKMRVEHINHIRSSSIMRMELERIKSENEDITAIKKLVRGMPLLLSLLRDEIEEGEELTSESTHLKDIINDLVISKNNSNSLVTCSICYHKINPKTEMYRCDACNTAKFHYSCYIKYIMSCASDTKESVACPCCRGGNIILTSTIAFEAKNNVLAEASKKITVLRNSIMNFNERNR